DAANVVKERFCTTEVDQHPIVDVDPEVILEVRLYLLSASIRGLAVQHAHCPRSVNSVLVRGPIWKRLRYPHVSRDAEQTHLLGGRVDACHHDRVRVRWLKVHSVGALIDAHDEKVD